MAVGALRHQMRKAGGPLKTGMGGGTFDRFSGLSSTEGPAINDAGQVVFLAILADGRRGIFVAEPTTLPTQIP